MHHEPNFRAPVAVLGFAGGTRGAMPICGRPFPLDPPRCDFRQALPKFKPTGKQNDHEREGKTHKIRMKRTTIATNSTD